MGPNPNAAWRAFGAYSFSYGQERSAGAAKHLAPEEINGSFLAKAVCGGQQREISIATDLKNRLPPGQVTGLWLPPSLTVTPLS